MGNRRRKTGGKRRKSVRCTLCTDVRWLGNASGRFKRKDELEMRDRGRLEEFEKEKDDGQTTGPGGEHPQEDEERL